MDSIQHKRNFSLDLARIIAAFAVVMIHCSARFVDSFGLFSDEFIVGNLLNSISRIAVPFFIMVSGALFLDEHKEVTLKRIFLVNVKNIVVIIIIWSAIYSFFYNIALPVLTDGDVVIENFIVGIKTGHYHMWYLYMIVGLYILTPFLKKVTSAENKNMVLTFIIISLITNFSPTVINILCNLGFNVSIINEIFDKFYFELFSGYITYYFVGWYIVHVGISKKWIKYLIYSLGVLSIAAVIVYAHFTGDYLNAYRETGGLVFFYSLSAFLLINDIKSNMKEETIKILSGISKLTFGVYIVHVMLITVFEMLMPYSGRHPAVYLATCFVAVSVGSFLISFVISKIPVLKKIIKA